MSFSKAALKRFNEINGCAPPVGAYDPKDSKNQKGPYIEKADRFKHPKDVAPSSDCVDYFRQSQLMSSTPRKCSSVNSSTSSESSSKSIVWKSAHVTISDHTGRIKDLELEVRQLLREKGEQDSRLQHLHDECRQLEERLNSETSDHSTCLTRVGCLELEAKEAKTALESVQAQLLLEMRQQEQFQQTLKQEHEAKCCELRQQLEAMQHKHEEAQQQVLGAQQELSRLQQLLQQSQEACSTWQQKWEELQQEHSATQQEVARLQQERDELQQQLKEQKDACGDTNQQLRAALHTRNHWKEQLEKTQQECRELQQQLQQQQENHSKMQDQLQKELWITQESLAKLQETGICVEEESKNLKLAKKDLEVRGQLMFDAIRHLKEESCVESDSMRQQLFEEAAEKALMEEHIDQLEQENKVLNASIRSLTDKFEALEKQLAFQEVQEQKVCTQLKTQIHFLEHNCHKLEDELERAQLMNKDLIESLTQFEDELSRSKSREESRTKEVEALSKVRHNLEAAIKSLMVDMHAVQQRVQEAETKMQHLETQARHSEVREEALSTQLEQQKNLAEKEQQELKDKLKSTSQERQKIVEQHRQELQSVKKALVLDRQEMDVKMSELMHRLERSQSLNIQMKDELKKLLADKDKLQQQIAELEEQGKKSSDTLQSHMTESHKQEEMLQLKLAAADEEQRRLKDEAEELRSAYSTSEELAQQYKKKWQQQSEQQAVFESRQIELEVEKSRLQSRINSISEENCRIVLDMEGQLQVMQEAALEERSGFEQIISEMSEKIQQLEDAAMHLKEKEDWKAKYEELFARVEPFMEQLDAFAAERELLLGQRQQDEAEVAKLMEKCAKLLGHQNHRQKIQYINKMKDDYMKCRKEKEELKEKLTKQNNVIQKLEKRLQALEGKKIDDPLQLLKGHQAVRSPLKQANTNIQP